MKLEKKRDELKGKIPLADIIQPLAVLKRSSKGFGKFSPITLEDIYGNRIDHDSAEFVSLIERSIKRKRKEESFEEVVNLLDKQENRIELREALRRIVKNITAQFSKQGTNNRALVRLTTCKDETIEFAVASHRNCPHVVVISDASSGNLLNVVSMLSPEKAKDYTRQHGYSPFLIVKKEEALKLLKQGLSVQEVSRLSGLSISSVYRLPRRED